MPKHITIKTFDRTITYELATFTQRFTARIYDTLIIIIPNSFIPVLAAWLYWAFRQSGRSKATFGQKSVGIMVVDVRTGRRISFGQASGRFFANFINLMTFSLGYFMFFFNDKRQCLHDFLSYSIVVSHHIVEDSSDNNDSIIEHLVE